MKPKIKAADEHAEFVLGVVDHARERRDEFEEVWEEVEQSFLVRPLRHGQPGTQYPFSGNTQSIGRAVSGRSILKDPETHQEIMTIVSGIIGAVYGEPGYVQTKHRGFEDIHRSGVSTELLKYTDQLPYAFLTEVEWLLGACIYGTGIKELFWDYLEEPRSVRSVAFDPWTGQEQVDETIMDVPVYDDVQAEAFDLRDFFIDFGQTRIERMTGAVRRFQITGAEARLRAERGIYRKDIIEDAIEAGIKASDSRDHSQDQTDLGSESESHPDFELLDVYRYIGTVPWDSADGIQKREVVVIGGHGVRDEAWPRRLPWFDIKITPRLGSFYGISPGEIVRHDQDFADTLKMMLADAVVRDTHPPIIYNKNVEMDLGRLRAYSPGVPIGVMGDPNAAIGKPNYKPQLGDAFAMYGGVKQQMREASSALGAEQGLGLGTKRYSGTEAAGTFEKASQRPELFNLVVERVYLPPCAKFKLELYQEFLGSTGDLLDRIGQSNATATLADIMPQFDVEYVGSRAAGGNADELAALREIIAAGANPALAPLIPWIPLFQRFLEKRGQGEIATMVGNPQAAMLYMMLHQITGAGGKNPQAGNNNGEVPSTPPSGLMPAQTLGSIQ